MQEARFSLPDEQLPKQIELLKLSVELKCPLVPEHVADPKNYYDHCKSLLDECRKREKNSEVSRVSKTLLLLEAVREIQASCNTDLVGIEDSQRICLITWLLTDPDADKSDFCLTKFQVWPWRSQKTESRDISVRLYFINSADRIQWLALVRTAWAKIEAGKDRQADKPLPPDYVPCAEIQKFVRVRSDSIARKLKASNYPVIKKAGRNYCDPKHAAVLFKKWKKHMRRQQENQ